MKTKQRAVIGLLTALIAISIAFTACKDDDPVCECPNGTVHTDAECSCKAVGYDCNCTHGEPTQKDNFNGTSIQIWYEYGVDATKADDIIEGIGDIYDLILNSTQKDNFVDGRITQIRIGFGSNVTMSGTILKIGQDITGSDFISAFVPLLSHLPTSTTIRLAQNTTRNTVGV